MGRHGSWGSNLRRRRRLGLGLTTTTLLGILLVLAAASPAAACADWLAVDRGQLGVIESPGITSLAAGPDDTLLIGASFEPRQVDLDGNPITYFDDAVGDVSGISYFSDGTFLVRRRGSLTRYDGSVERSNGIELMRVFGGYGTDPTLGIAYVQGWSVHLLHPDGTPNTAFNGTGSASLDLPRANINAEFNFAMLGVRPAAANSVQILGVWRGAPLGSVLQFIEVDADGTTTIRASQTQAVNTVMTTSNSLVSSNGWELALYERSHAVPELLTARLVKIDPQAGTITTTRGDLELDGQIARDDRGNMFLVDGGRYLIPNDSGIHPMVSGARRGEPTAINAGRSWTGAVTGLAMLPDGQWTLAIRPSQITSDLPHGVYIFRGSSSPERYIVGGLTDQVTRLYAAALGRQPDVGGLGSWARLRASGVDVETLAAIFLASPEFEAHYGDLNNHQFVAQLYRFVLGREGDEQGVAYWNNELFIGNIDRAGLPGLFADSPENIERTETLPPFPLEAELYRLYRAVFLRPPDPDGHCYRWNARASRPRRPRLLGRAACGRDHTGTDRAWSLRIDRVPRGDRHGRQLMTS